MIKMLLLGILVSATVQNTTPTDTDNVVQGYQGLRIAVGNERIYGFGGYDEVPVRFGGQRGADIDLWSLGFGIRGELTSWLSVFGDVGWYEPQFNEAGRPQELGVSNLAEGLMIHQNQRLFPPYWPAAYDIYTLDYSGNVGGTIGVTLMHQITDNAKVGIHSAYRYLRLEEQIKGMPSSGVGGYWDYKEDRDFGGWQIGAQLMVDF